MSIASVAGNSGSPLTTGSGTLPTLSAGAPVAASGGQSSGTQTSGIDEYKAPTPPRFPWLSRLSLQLDAAAKQKPPFQSAPLLGDNLDKQV